MASDAELLQLYGELRQALLSRHWVTTRYFPSCYVADINHLGTQKEGLEASAKHLRPPEVRGHTVATVNDLFALDPSSDGLQARWTVGEHEHENPLIHTGSTLSCLAVEDLLGSASARC